jgi:hypothetical protein
MPSFYSTLPSCVLNFLPLVGLVCLVGSVGLVLQAAWLFVPVILVGLIVFYFYFVWLVSMILLSGCPVVGLVVLVVVWLVVLWVSGWLF